MSPRVTPPTASNSFERFRNARRTQRSLEEGTLSRSAKIPSRGEAWWWFAAGESNDFEDRTLSKASGAAGNYLVPTDFYEQIMAVVRDLGSVAQLAKEIVTDNGRTLNMPLVSTHGVGAWTSENASTSVSDDVFSLLGLGAYKAAVSCIVSEELLADSGVPIDSYLAGELGERLAALEGSAFVNGSGTGQPQGALANFPVSTAATGSSTSFKLVDLVTALHTVAPLYREANGAWVVSDGALQALRGVTDTAGRPILIEPNAPEGRIFLLGYPVFTDANMPAPGANAKSMMFAGWSKAYVVRRVIGLSAFRQQNELYALNGQVGFRAVERVDGRVIFAPAGVALQHSAT